VIVDTRREIREFLTSRRAKITPEQAGLTSHGQRRVPGLRREEVAVLAGVSTDWYTRLEKGHIAGVSEDVLEAVARALQLDDAERTYLFDLARAAARPTRTPQRRGRAQIQPRVQWMLDSMTASAAFVANGRLDIVAANSLGRALHAPLFDVPGRSANFARFQFLDPRAHDFYPDWEGAANVTVALLRAEAGRHPNDTQLRELVGELSTVSEEFRTRWAAHDVRILHNGAKGFRHPVVGALDLGYYTLELPTEDHRGLRLTIYTAEPGSPSEDALKLLASWAVTTADPSAPATDRA
jgi:transcriptional regulator with XRE-family HTH domain